jgi:hypothetical protein
VISGRAKNRYAVGNCYHEFIKQKNVYLMKQLYTIIAILFISFSAAQAKPVIIFTASSGDWSKSSNWDLNRIPQHGD